MSKNNKEKLLKINNEIIKANESPLYSYRIKNNFRAVVGEGNNEAEIMFIAEAPGINEVKTGRHFQGAAGKIFDQLINLISLKREDIYITNIIKDKLPENRDPLLEEIDFYVPFLIRQIKIIKPKIIVTIGRFSSNYLLEKCKLKIQSISNIHGQVITFNCSYGKCSLMPMFHTAAVLYNQQLIETMKKDFSKLKKLMFKMKII
jgi:uracil-DNA glycosylase